MLDTPNHTNKRPLPTLLSVIVLLIVVVIFVFTISARKESSEPPVDTTVFHNPFDSVVLEASAAYVFDTVRGEVLFRKNEEVQLPLASLTKLMTALVVQESLSAPATVAIGNNAISQEGDSGLFVGQKWRVKDLLNIVLVSSSNDGAYALAAAAGGRVIRENTEHDRTMLFLERMNARARELGLSQTYFLSPSGLDVNQEAVGGAVGSARDVATLFTHLLHTHPQVLEATTHQALHTQSFDGEEYTVENTNTALADFPWLIASKTGFTNLAGGNLAIAFDAGLAHPVIAVVLGSTREERFEDMKTLVDATFKYLSR